MMNGQTMGTHGEVASGPDDRVTRADVVAAPAVSLDHLGQILLDVLGRGFEEELLALRVVGLALGRP